MQRGAQGLRGFSRRVVKRLRPILFGAATGFAGMAVAGSAPGCPTSFPPQPPGDRARLQAEADRLSQMGEACRERADYFAYQGILFLGLRRPQEAALALEKALMLEPELAGTQLDYAQALAELGEMDSARGLAREVANRPDIPGELHAWLTARLRDWRNGPWRFEWTAELLVGHESNLNSAPDLSYLTLTLPGGSVPVELAASERAVSGVAQRLNLNGAAARGLGDGLVSLNAQVSGREAAGHSETALRQISLGAGYARPGLGGQVGLRVDSIHLDMGGQAIYGSRGAGLLYQLPPQLTPAECRGGLGHGVDRRDFPASPVLSGTYAGTQAWLSCGGGANQFNLALQSGHDRARDPARLGGEQKRLDLILSGSHAIGPGTLSVTAQLGRARDAEVYSALLGGEPRRSRRGYARLSYEYPLTPGVAVIGYVEQTRQESNIDLFTLKGSAVYFGARWHSQ